ncbi:MAG: hypothetical protein IPK26_11280 [Planctomycetes bacterium]|nr:hypothetical protein [Planctomycetota bacterium]
MLRTPVALLLATASLAQDLRWNLPPHGAALYRRERTLTPGEHPPGAPWGGEPPAAVVLAGELDDAAQRSTEPLIDLREVFAVAALDLSLAKAGKSSVEASNENHFANVKIELVYGAIDATGRQEISGTIGAPKADKVAARRPDHIAKVSGSLRGFRRIDKAAGRVAEFDGTIELKSERKEGGGAFTIRDHWTFERLLDGKEAEFRARVAEGIRTGAAAVRQELERFLERDPHKPDDVYHDHQPGELALMLLTLVKAGEDVRDPLLQKGYEELRRRNIEGTYELACAILATEALYTPAGEWQDLREGRLKAPMPRVLAEGDKARLAEWLPDLMDNIDSTVDAAYIRRWHYGPSTTFDNSNTQYALLGLFAAQLCGAEISPQVWTASGNHWLQCKIAGNLTAAPQLVTHQDLAKQAAAGGKGTRTRTGGKVPMRGWAYVGTGDVTGSMTCAGITGLTLASAGLRDKKKGNANVLRDIDEAVRGGFLWLEHNLSVRRNPGPPNVWNHWVYYYLYGLERTCELNQVALLGDRDWYFEGAMQILGQQRGDGGWGGANDTCFAVLFLKKTALPVLTPR